MATRTPDLYRVKDVTRAIFSLKSYLQNRTGRWGGTAHFQCSFKSTKSNIFKI